MSDSLQSLAESLAARLLREFENGSASPTHRPPAKPGRQVEKSVLPTHDPSIPWNPEAPASFPAGRIAGGEVPIGISARHCHVTQEALEILFGPGHELTFDRPLMQMGEFAARERVAIVSPAGLCLRGLRILGPVRNLVQVELAQTDLRALDFSAPIRPSGRHEGTPGLLMVGPKGSWQMQEGVIRANRHVHLHSSQAAALGLSDNDTAVVHVDGPKPTTLWDVQVRVRDTFVAQMHLDTDDANALDVGNGHPARILRKL